MTNIVLFILLGLMAGILAGLIGIGGGIIIVPALVFLFGLPQQEAQGMTLALLIPPIGIIGRVGLLPAGLREFANRGFHLCWVHRW